ncbi:hypothetical protein C2E23DRAFT_861651 [Lenzites betulinus]|nr:hypothetical protein C2E23DRAFT_861651 [Lenzites betulinus]
MSIRFSQCSPLFSPAAHDLKLKRLELLLLLRRRGDVLLITRSIPRHHSPGTVVSYYDTSVRSSDGNNLKIAELSWVGVADVEARTRTGGGWGNTHRKSYSSIAGFVRHRAAIQSFIDPRAPSTVSSSRFSVATASNARPGLGDGGRKRVG